jgi:spermidine synthase
VKKTHAAPPPSSLPTFLKRFLYATAAITGAAILIVEILGAKMLAPYVGTSHFVWTAQIAVTLVALAAGYYAGGRLVDRAPHLRKLYAAILLAALYLGLSVMLVEPVAYWCLKFKLAIGSLLASAFLFFIPLALLAMVGPFLVRVLTESVSGVGSNVGRLTSISTLGSVAGTGLIGYVLIPFLPNSVTMYLTAALLLSVCVAYFFVCDRRHPYRPTVAGAVVLLALLWLGTYRLEQLALRNSTERFRANSNFGLLQVLDNQAGTRRLYLNDYLLQNTYDPATKQSTSMFTYLLHDLARAYTPKLERVLCVGLGVGIAPMKFATGGAAVDVVEINPKVLPIAREFFDCQLERLNVVIGDGRHFINQAQPRSYDAINLDAFLGDSSPVHLFTKEAFAAMRRLLKPDGVLVMNVFGDFTPGRDFFMASLERTLREGAGFRSVKIHAAGGGNVFFVASDQPELKVLQAPDFEQVHPACRHQARTAFETLQQVDPAHGRVLTDDHNPLEYYDAANRERVRRDYALSVRAMREQRY